MLPNSLQSIKAALVRGKYLNNFEGQNFIFDNKKIKLTGISSFNPIHEKFPFPTIELPSIADVPGRKIVNYLSNRIIGDSQILFGLEKIAPGFDLVDTADPHYYYSYQLARLRKSGKIKKLIVTYCETIPFNNESVAKKRYIKKFSMKYADLFIVHTQRSKKCLIREGVRESKIKIVKLGVDLEKFKPRNRQSHLRGVIVLFVGRLVEEKGINDLHKAFERIHNHNIKLKIISGYPYEQMPEIYRNADIFVLPSKTTQTGEEQYGMALIEAMASGLPVIAYNCGAVAENLGNVGILIRQSDIDGLIKSILRLSKDKDLRLKLGTMGRRRAEKHFDSRKTAKNLTNLYESIVHNSDKK